MVDKLDDVWASRDLPLPTEIARQMEAGNPHVRIHDLIPRLGLDEAQAERASEALEEAGYISGIKVASWNGPIIVTSISTEARRAVGLWPSEDQAADRLLTALEASIARATTPEQRTRLVRLRDGFASAGRDVTVGIATAVLTGQLPQ